MYLIIIYIKDNDQVRKKIGENIEKLISILDFKQRTKILILYLNL